MTSQELAQAIWRDPEVRVNKQDWVRWVNSGYHITTQQKVDTLFEEITGLVDLGLPEWYCEDLEHDSVCARNTGDQHEDCTCGNFNARRVQFYQEAESPEVLAFLSVWAFNKYFYPCTDLPTAASFLAWYKDFFPKRQEVFGLSAVDNVFSIFDGVRKTVSV